MSILKFQPQVFKINDVLGWHERKELVLEPNFQRRKVWSPKGKSYLIDSILRGFPLPQIFIREKLLIKDRKTIREVVDGQQRLSAIFEYINDKFKVSSVHYSDFSNLKFSQLPEEIQQDFLMFPLSVNMLGSVDEADVLGIFSRINAYSVPLNNQEKLNAEFVGAFKQFVEDLSRSNLAYWESCGILSRVQIARMKEQEFTAELIGAILLGIQNGKGIVKELYETYDDEFSGQDDLTRRFNETLELCRNICPGQMRDLEFSRPPLFYSLFYAVYSLRFPSTDSVTSMNEDAISTVKQELYELNQSILGESNVDKYPEFVRAAKSSTDKLPNRIVRHKVLVEIMSSLFHVN